jgi:mannose-1-phosphate guanylyltransferase
MATKAAAAAAGDLVVVILAGGAGTRFWPASTAKKPKQFLKLTGERSLIQLTYDRVKDIVPAARVLVITAKKFVPTVRKHLPELPAANVIGEPMRRDTAAAVALATLLVHQRFGTSTMAVLTADHLIGPAEAFQGALLSAAKRARTGKNVYTFGIPPTYPSTGFGYLEVGDQIMFDGGVGHHAVLSFHEKPDLATAEKYIASKRFFWNSGMFVFQTDFMLQTMRFLIAEHISALEPVAQAKKLSPKALEKAFQAVQSVSIDKAVMEKLETTMCVRANFNWSDVGGFPALAAHLSRDDKKNAVRGRLRVRESTGNVVWCEDPKEVVALVGVSGLCVVRAGKRTLVVPIERAEEIKKLVEGLPPGEQ